MALGQPLLFIGIQGPRGRQDHLLHVNVRDLELAEVAAALLHVVFLDHVQGHFWSDAAGCGLLGLDRDGVAGVRLHGDVAPHAAAAQQRAIQFSFGQHCAQVAVFQLLGFDQLLVLRQHVGEFFLVYFDQPFPILLRLQRAYCHVAKH